MLPAGGVFGGEFYKGPELKWLHGRNVLHQQRWPVAVRGTPHGHGAALSAYRSGGGGTSSNSSKECELPGARVAHGAVLIVP